MNCKHLKPKPGLHPDEKAFNLNSVPEVNFINVKKVEKIQKQLSEQKREIIVFRCFFSFFLF